MVLIEKLFFGSVKYFTNCTLTQCILLLVILALFFLILRFINAPKPAKTPFSTDHLREPEQLVTDHKIRDAILKQGFTKKKIPDDLDAIVIGSGIGGLTTAALMAKSEKKVLVLEQHDQAGGCCHTFIDKGFEFDVGIHYIGGMANMTMSKVLVDQITDGQLVWNRLDDTVDVVMLGDQTNPKKIPIVCLGPDKFKKALIEHFPEEEKAIEKYMELLKKTKNTMTGYILVKILPMFLTRFLIFTGLINILTDYFKYSSKTTSAVLDELTDNVDLKAVMAYSFGDYGVTPNESPFTMQSTLMNHYMHGAYYPKGGASEIAFHIIPVIQRAGGNVFVRAPVTQILLDQSGKATGVRVKKGGEDHDIFAPLIISTAGIFNTYNKLLPPSVKSKPEIKSVLSSVKHGTGAMSIFIGLDATKEELGLKPQNYWAFTDSHLDDSCKRFFNLSVEEVGLTDVPLLFISFPSTKDPSWDDRFPGKTTCAIVTLANYEWFQAWEDERVMKRGENYETIKNRIADKLWEQTCKLFPQIKDRRCYVDVGSPLTNNYYIASPRGEIYGLDHNKSRFSAHVGSQLRPESPVPGLYLSGQDILTCGFTGAMYGGLMTASKVLNRNGLTDLMKFAKYMKTTVKASKKHS